MQSQNPLYAKKYVRQAPPVRRSHWFIKVTLFVVLGITLAKITVFHPNAHVSAATKLHRHMPTQSVCLDAGHGGEDPGAQNGSLTEAATNLIVAKKVRLALQAKGYGVYMTRTTDTTLTNADRVNFCNATKATILVAIHQNSYTDSGPDYSTALQYKPQDAALANTLANAAGAELGLPVTPPMQFADGMLMRATMPSAIIESLFISNDAEAAAMSANNVRIDQQAQGIINGITTYLQAHKLPSHGVTTHG